MIKVGLEEKKPKNIQETSLLLLSWLFTALANGGMLNNGVTRVQRGQVSDALHSLSSAEAMTGPLQDPEMKKRAELDWRELQPDVCEWSPIPLLEALLKDESWAEIDVSPRAIIDSFAARVRELAEHVDDGS